MGLVNWKGYLFKAVKTGREFPHYVINEETWTSNPNQREEIKAYRDDNTRNLTRITASGKKTAFSFQTRDGLTLAQKIEVQEFFTSAEVDSTQRKIQLEYWDDENNIYKTGYFYRPNMEFPIKKIEKGTIKYKPLKFEFVEY